MAMTIREEFIDELVKDCKTAADVLGSKGIVKELTNGFLNEC